MMDIVLELLPWISTAIWMVTAFLWWRIAMKWKKIAEGWREAAVQSNVAISNMRAALLLHQTRYTPPDYGQDGQKETKH